MECDGLKKWLFLRTILAKKSISANPDRRKLQNPIIVASKANHGNDPGCGIECLIQKVVRMLSLTLSASDISGVCLIDGAPTDYRIRPGHIEFRRPQTVEWDRRQIVSVVEEGDSVKIVCGDGAGPDHPNRPSQSCSSFESRIAAGVTRGLVYVVVKMVLNSSDASASDADISSDDTAGFDFSDDDSD